MEQGHGAGQDAWLSRRSTVILCHYHPDGFYSYLVQSSYRVGVRGGILLLRWVGVPQPPSPGHCRVT